MTFRLPRSPNVAHATGFPSLAAVTAWLNGNFIAQLIRNFNEISTAVNSAVFTDGSAVMVNPLVVAAYLKTAMPTASSWTNGLIMVTNDATFGRVLCYSDGTNWRHVRDGNVVS